MSSISQFLGENLNILGSSINNVSRITLNSLYPKEFEAYLISLELVDYNDNIEEYFTFPVNPNYISKVDPRVKSIDRTFGAIIVNKSDQFVPKDIILKGNFGRDFKVVLRHKGEVTFNSFLNKSAFVSSEEFNPIIKSGYGSLKILQNICEKSEMSINGLHNKLFFHNYLLGESYLVEVIDFTQDQSLASNMMWGYTLRLKVISPVGRKDGFILKTNISSSVVGSAQETLNKSLGSVRKLISSMI